MADFEDAIKLLELDDYRIRIFESNSRGELFHLEDFVMLAKCFGHNPTLRAEFKIHFRKIVSYAEENWDRPESVFQHIPKILKGEI